MENDDFKVKIQAKVEHQFIFHKEHRYNIFYEENSTNGKDYFIKELNKEVHVNNYEIKNILLCNRDKLVSIFVGCENSNIISNVKINE